MQAGLLQGYSLTDCCDDLSHAHQLVGANVWAIGKAKVDEHVLAEKVLFRPRLDAAKH